MGLVTTDSNLILTGTSDSNPLFPVGLADLSATGQDAGLGQEGESYATGTDLVGENYAPPEIGDGAMAGYVDTIMGDSSRRRKKGAGEDDSADPFAPAYVPPPDETPPQTVVVTPPAGPANNAPTLGASVLTVAENSAGGTSAGFVPAADLDGDTLTWSLVNDSGGLFDIDAATGEVTVQAGATMDYEAGTTQTIRVRVEDGNGGAVEGDVTVNVTDVAENAAAVANVTGPAINTLDATDVRPFAAATVTHPDAAATLTATVTLDNAAKGALSGAGITSLGGGVYQITGTAAQVQTALQAAVFDATDNRLNATGQIDATTLTVSITDGTGGSASQSIIVNATQAQDPAAEDMFLLPFAITQGAMSGGAGYDVVQLQDGTNRFDTTTDLAQTVIMRDIEEVRGGAGADTLTFDGSANIDHMLVDLQGGTDTLILNGDATLELMNIETVNATVGQQILGIWTNGAWAGDLGADANDELWVGANITLNMTGVDTIYFDNAGSAINMGYALTGQNVISNSIGNGTLQLFGQDNTLGIFQDGASITGTALDDTLTMTDRLIGQPGTPPLVDLGAGNDTLNLSRQTWAKLVGVETVVGTGADHQEVLLSSSYAGGSASITTGTHTGDIVDLEGPMTISLALSGVEVLRGYAGFGSYDITLLNAQSNANPLDIQGMGGAADVLQIAAGGGINKFGLVQAVEDFRGTAGNDVVQIGSFSSTNINLGGGDDRLEITSTDGCTGSVNLGSGADTLAGLNVNSSSLNIQGFSFLEGDRLDFSGRLTQAQLLAGAGEYIRFEYRAPDVAGNFGDKHIWVQIDNDGSAGPGGWDTVGVLTDAISTDGTLNGDGVADASSQAQFDTIVNDMVASGQIYSTT